MRLIKSLKKGLIILIMVITVSVPVHATGGVSVTYAVHVQHDGTQSAVPEGRVAGTTGRGLRLEGLWINLNNASGHNGGIQYRSHIQRVGWESKWHNGGQMSGTTGRSLRLEAMEIRLTGDLANYYDVYYRVHAQRVGWMNWAANGNPAGTEGFGLRLEALQIVIVPKNSGAPAANPGNATNDSYRNANASYVEYTSHVQRVGTQGYVKDGAISGTVGQGLRMEGIIINKGTQIRNISGNIQYRSHIQRIGWEGNWHNNGELSGTTGRSLRLEAIEVRLTGDLANKYDIYYRVHAQRIGWMNWAANGNPAGTEGYGLRLEALEIALKPKNSGAPGANPGNATNESFRRNNTMIEYASHVQRIGTQNYVKDGELSGTTGQGLRVEGLMVRKGYATSNISGNIQYRTYVQNNGWEGSWHQDGQYSGTQGKGLQIEGVQIKLTGAMASRYDVWYQVHAERLGWMGWTKNGASAGTAGYGYRVEGIHIVLKNKNAGAPGSTNNSYIYTDTRGIDISEHNQDIDLSPYQKNFVIIRAGYGWSNNPSKATPGNFGQIDKRFVENVRKCESLGIPYGIYWFSYATNASEAKKEAETFYYVTKNYNPALGFWMDEEGDAWKTKHNKNYANKNNITDIVNNFTNTMGNHGRKIGVYASYDWFQRYISTGRPKWVAHYGAVDNGNKNVDLSKYNHCVIHQYTSVPLDRDILQVPLAKIF